VDGRRWAPDAPRGRRETDTGKEGGMSRPLPTLSASPQTTTTPGPRLRWRKESERRASR